VSFRPLDFALRETRDTFAHPRVLGGLSVVGLLIGYVGPFGSRHELPLVPRMAYWLALIALTYGLGVFTAALMRIAIAPFRLDLVWRVLILGLVASVPILAVVIGINALFLGVPVPMGIELLGNWISTLVIALGVVVLHMLVRRAPERVNVDQSADRPGAPPLMARLPVDLRGPLVRLSMQDHYVEVETAKGKALVLLRLSDAIRETEGTRGLQVHRSHWVALDRIVAVRRQDGKVLVETASGTVLPVSRTYLPDLKAAGLLPK